METTPTTTTEDAVRIELPALSLWKMLDAVDRSHIAPQVRAMGLNTTAKIEGQTLYALPYHGVVGYSVNGGEPMPAYQVIDVLMRTTKCHAALDALDDEEDREWVAEALNSIMEDENAFCFPFYAVWAEGGPPVFQGILRDLPTDRIQGECDRIKDVSSRQALTPGQQNDFLSLQTELTRRA